MEEFRLWGRIIKNHRIEKNETVPFRAGEMEEAMLELCRRFDIQRPLQLAKHDRDLENFGRTFYAREHFTEPVGFQKLEIEILLPDGDAHRGSAPRSPLSEA